MKRRKAPPPVAVLRMQSGCRSPPTPVPGRPAVALCARDLQEIPSFVHTRPAGHALLRGGSGLVESMSRRGWLLFAVISVLWGISYLLIKVAVSEVSASVLVLARTAVGSGVLLPLAIRSSSLVMLRRCWPWVLVFTALQIMGPWWLQSDAELRLSSSVSAVFVATVPIISVVLARFFGDTERLTTMRLAGLLVGLAGVVLLAVPHLGSGTAVSVGELLLAALGGAAAPLIAAHRLAEVPGIVLAAGCLTLAALFYIGPAAATWPATIPSGRVLWALASLAVLCTALAFVAFFALIREVGATRTTVITYVIPAVGVLAGVVLLGEPFSPAMISAFAMILVGSVLATEPGHAPAGENHLEMASTS
jgi:drug/metabolite transporter (DMT)-like permease